MVWEEKLNIGTMEMFLMIFNGFCKHFIEILQDNKAPDQSY